MVDPTRGVWKAVRCFFISRTISGFLDCSEEKTSELRPAVTGRIFSFIWVSVICRILMFHLGNQSTAPFDVCRGFFFFGFWALSRFIWTWMHWGHSMERLHWPALGRDQQRLVLRATFWAAAKERKTLFSYDYWTLSTFFCAAFYKAQMKLDRTFCSFCREKKIK